MWENIARIKEIPLDTKSKIIFREQVKKFLNKFERAVILLKYNHTADENGSRLSEQQIKELGGILLTKNLDETGESYVGIAVLKEKVGPDGARVEPGDEVERLVLHLCPVKRNATEFNLDDLMPAAIQTLKEQRIIPDYLSGEVGDPINTRIFYNFENWQKKAATKLDF